MISTVAERLLPRKKLVVTSAAVLMAAVLAGPVGALAQSAGRWPVPMPDGMAAVAPALDRYAGDVLDKVWTRPGLSTRDRCIVVLAALIARGETTDLPAYVAVALDSGVKPAELSGLITHLAFYAGWENAMAAVTAVRPVLAARGIGPAQLAPAAMSPLPLDEKAEAARAAAVDQALGTAAPDLVQDTTSVLFHDLWLRPDLTPRDRSLVTISALIATGQLSQLSGHLTRALANGLTRGEASAAIDQLAYYGGWPNAFSAAAIARTVFEQQK